MVIGVQLIVNLGQADIVVAVARGGGVGDGLKSCNHARAVGILTVRDFWTGEETEREWPDDGREIPLLLVVVQEVKEFVFGQRPAHAAAELLAPLSRLGLAAGLGDRILGEEGLLRQSRERQENLFISPHPFSSTFFLNFVWIYHIPWLQIEYCSVDIF